MILLIFFAIFASAELPGLGLLLDGNQLAGIKEYKRALGVAVDGGGNIGLIQYNLGLLSANSCFRNRAIAMYKELQVGQELNLNNNNLESRLPKGSFAPGFLWQLSMKHAGDDPNLAMALIGICGHDNTNQLGAGIFPVLGVQCPDMGSAVYTPGSLAENASIARELQQRIGEVQGNNGDSSFISAKYYHVIGAASTSCLMLRRGVPVAMARTAVTTAVNAYRISRLCQDLNSVNSDESQVFEKMLDGSIPMPPAPSSDLSHNQHQQYSKMFAGYEESVQNVLINNGAIFLAPTDIAKKKVQRLVSIINAKKILFSNKDIKQECSKPPYISTRLANYLKKNNHRKSACPKDVSSKFCEEALHRIDTWAVDREWTEAQHLAGFDFAKNNCTPTYKDDDAIERSACRVQQKIGIDGTDLESGVAQ